MIKLIPEEIQKLRSPVSKLWKTGSEGHAEGRRFLAFINSFRTFWVNKMAELVQIPLANAEYVARFERPYIGFIANERARVIEVVFNALLPFNMRLADIDTVNSLPYTFARHFEISR
jgi:hypothetical protein